MAAEYSVNPNYRGMLFATSSKETPFLNRVLQNGSKFGSFVFNDNVSSAVGAGAQDTVAESATIAGPAATAETKTPVSNTCEIRMVKAETSLRKMADVSHVASGLNNDQGFSNPDGLPFQKAKKLLKLANGLEYSLIQGTYQAAADEDTAAQTRGITAHISTNNEAAGGAGLSKTLIDNSMLDLVQGGATANNIIAVCRPKYKPQLDTIFGTQPESRTEGGINLNTYYTSLGWFTCIYTNNAPDNTVLFVNIENVFARWNVPDVSQIQDIVAAKGISSAGNIQLYDLDDQGRAFNGLFWIPDLGTAASVGGWFYGHFGGEYGPETYHSKITGLA